MSYLVRNSSILINSYFLEKPLSKILIAFWHFLLWPVVDSEELLQVLPSTVPVRKLVFTSHSAKTTQYFPVKVPYTEHLRLMKVPRLCETDILYNMRPVMMTICALSLLPTAGSPYHCSWDRPSLLSTGGEGSLRTFILNCTLCNAS